MWHSGSLPLNVGSDPYIFAGTMYGASVSRTMRGAAVGGGDCANIRRTRFEVFSLDEKVITPGAATFASAPPPRVWKWHAPVMPMYRFGKWSSRRCAKSGASVKQWMCICARRRFCVVLRERRDGVLYLVLYGYFGLEYSLRVFVRLPRVYRYRLAESHGVSELPREDVPLHVPRRIVVVIVEADLAPPDVARVDHGLETAS